MSEIALQRPELLWLAIPLVALMALITLRLRSLAPWRRYTALVLQSLSVLLLLTALAEPAFVKPDTNMSLVVVLDASDSLSEASRQQAIAYAKGVQASAKSTDSIYFVATGRQATVLTPPQVASGEWATKRDSSGAKATNLAAGLRLAGTLLRDTGRRRVVLVSDGWETQGQAQDEASRLSARDIDLEVVGMAALGTPEVVVERLSTQAYARVGDTVPSELSVFSTGSTSAVLSISVDGAPVSTRQASLRQGENSVSLEPRALTEGFHRIEASVQTAADTNKLNNQATATLVVKPEPSVLVLQEREGEADPLANALGSQGMKVDVGFPSAIPSRLKDLDAYDSIILNDVAATSFTLDQQRTLQEYVRRNGRGLVVVGGPTSFGKGDYLSSVFEEMLPVSSRPAPRPQTGQVALVLVIDRSSSMRDYGSMGDYRQSEATTKFAMALDAGRLAVDSLREGDNVGVLVFDNSFEWAVPIERISSPGDKERIKDTISEIQIGNATAIYPALVEAAHALAQVDAPTRHLVLLTDGMEQGGSDYTTLLSQLRDDNINLSTIGVGQDADRILLTRLAREGRGRYYFTEKPENIPKIVFKEIDLTLRESILEGTIQPHLSAPSPLLRGFSPQDVPQLGGYDITVPKDDALVALTTDSGDPLLAQWNYGLGRVVAFTSEASAQWAAKWLSWTEFARFWNQAVRWTMASPVNRQLQPSVTYFDDPESPQGTGQAHITVESLNADNTFADLADITAALRSPSGAVTSTLLTQTAPGRYEATVPVSERGAYELRVQRVTDANTGGDDGQPATETAGFSVPTAAEYLKAGTNDHLLKRLTNGAPYYTQPAQALDSTGLSGAAPEREPLWLYLLPPALLLLLASVAVRRVDFGRRER